MFPETNSMGCRVAESFSINKDREAVLRFSSLASENNVDCIVIVLFFVFFVFLCVLYHLLFRLPCDHASQPDVCSGGEVLVQWYSG